MGPNNKPMKPIVSLITPTHKTDRLLRLYESIEAQTNKHFEWIVIPNGGADVSILPKKKWIRIVPYTNTNLNIGALKHFGFMQGKGELLAEVDHDDELLPHCVESLIANKDKADFLYSNNIVFDKNNDPYVWTGAGWVVENYIYKGKQCPVNKAFPPLPTNFAWQWWAPNHIRVWNNKFYHSIGGHDINLKACDDGDILCRTMAHGTIHHINDVLYAYYLHPDNTHADKEISQWIQQHAKKMYSDYIVPMTMRWCKENNYKTIGKESLFDSKLKNNSVGLIVIEDLHHLPAPDIWMIRISNVLVPGGVAIIANPLKIENTNKVTVSNLRFWDKTYSKLSIRGSNLQGNYLEIKNNKMIVYFTKSGPEVQLAQNVLTYPN
jgi:glycosyltransferase involved in cell wall biosynthesis